MWLSIASKLVPGMIKTGMSIASNRRRTKELESVAEMKHAERMASGELEYKKAVIANNNQGWKDEFVLILVSAPVMILIWSIFSDDPEIMSKVDKFFEQFNSMPFWYQALFIGVVSAIYGLTLTAAKTVIYFNNTYDMEVRLQSEDRAHRIGQTDSVTYIDFVCPNTIDEKILQALSTKKKLADQITGDNWKELFL